MLRVCDRLPIGVAVTLVCQHTYHKGDLLAGKGKYWLYWFPSQYTAAIKVRIIGVSALI